MGSAEKKMKNHLLGTGNREMEVLVWIFTVIYSIFLAVAVILLFIDV